ncbi:MAG: hypothetical protein HQL86_05325 [Magnetococcales bacterium]|nr:hypothetical protein [Magnetococcales bacterium]
MPRRTRHGRAFWLGHIEACERAGGTVQAYLLEHGLSEQSFYRWQKKLQSSGDLSVLSAAPMFQRLEISPFAKPLEDSSNPNHLPASHGNAVERSDPVVEVITDCRIRLPNGAVLEVGGSLSAGLIGRLLQVVGTLPVVDGRVSR